MMKHDQIYEIREKSFLELKSETWNCEYPVTITQLLGYLIHRVNYVTDKKTVGIPRDIYKQQHTRKYAFSTKFNLVALMHDFTLTKAQLRVLKAYLWDYFSQIQMTSL